MLKYLVSCSLVLSSLCGCELGQDIAKFEEGTLVPREVLFAKPDKFCVRLSPDGKNISYFARSGSEVVLCIDTVEGKSIRRFPVTSARNMYHYYWAYTNNHILLPEDNQGDENDHILCLNIKTGQKKDLTPFGKSKSYVIRLSEKFLNEILVCNNKRNAKWFDVYKINIETGKSEKVFENNAYISMTFNESFELKALTKILENGDAELLSSNGKLILKVPFEDTGFFGAYHLKKGENILYVSLPMGKDKASLVSINIDTKEIKVLCEVYLPFCFCTFCCSMEIKGRP